jgi:tetratricopeptide (TPR) repeat protein
VWIILALGLLGLWALGVALARSPAPDRVLILGSSLDSAGRELGPGLEALIEDHLEVLTGATVTHASALPAAAELKHLPPATRLLRFQGRREGDLLHLAAEWNTAAGLLTGRSWTPEAASTLEPAQAMAALVRGWPLKVRYRYQRELLPQSPAHFWALVEAMAIHDDLEATTRLPAMQQLAEEEPQCATVWTTLGDHLYRSLWINPEAAGVGLSSRTHRAFQQAVNLVPGHPRATFLWSLMLTDTGNQDAALRALVAAARLRPGTPELYHGFAYAGRTAGLLEGARRALVRRKALLGSQDEPSTWFAETTHLYRGDLEAFRQELQRAGALRQDASILFYQGYFAILQGRPREALGFMKAGSGSGMAPTPFRDLCRVYLAYLEGRPRDGLAELQAIDEVRGKLRIPDGEWTFKEAEAYSLLGDADRGVDCATRAFVQGFSCAAWYEASPFLAKVRAHSRWPMLRRNIRERQAVLEGSFPPAAFDP